MRTIYDINTGTTTVDEAWELPATTPTAPQLSWDQFRELFPPEKRLVLLGAVLQSPALLEFTLDAVAQGVDLGSERTIAGLDALVAAGLLTSEEREQLLLGEALD